jgi:uncharacterized protein YciI
MQRFDRETIQAFEKMDAEKAANPEKWEAGRRARMTQTMVPDSPKTETQSFSALPTWIGIFSLRPGLHDLTAWSDAERNAVAAHFEILVRQAREGRLVIAGRSNDQDGENRLAADTIGISIFHAPDRAEAHAIMEADPAVVAGVMVYRLHSYNIAVARDGLA